MSDLISRETVIYELEDWKDHCMTDAEAWHLKQVIFYIKTLPSSAEPERKWIPVTEALPKDMDRLLATIVRSDGSKRVRSGHYYKEYFMMDNGDTWNATDKEILAWMPLPEPKEEEDENAR